MHRVAVGALLASLCLPAVTACSGDPSQAAPETSPSTVSLTLTTPPTAPTSSPSTAPVTSALPPLAKTESSAGANAFVRFYMDVINRSWHARWGSLVRRYSDADCVSCRGIASSMDKIREDGGFYRGGDWIVTSTTPVPLQESSRPIIHTAVTVTAGAWKRSEADRLRRIRADKMYIDVHLVWSQPGWRVVSMVPA